MKSSKYGIALILLIPIGLVAGPVLWAGMRSEIAHWYLAAAANAIELGKGDADKSIESARAWDPEVGRLQDYLTVCLRQFRSKEADLSLSDIFKQVPEDSKLEIAEQLARQFGSKGDFALAADVMRTLLGEQVNRRIIYWDVMISRALTEESEAKAIQTLRDAITANPDNSTLRILLAEEFASILDKREDFTSTLEAYKLWFGEKYDRTVYRLNALAYGRALANVELDQALVDIDEALGHRPDDPELRDTRAWVYYQLGRYEEAFLDADFSVKTRERPSISSWLQAVWEWLQVAAESPETNLPLGATSEEVPDSGQVAEEVAEEFAEFGTIVGDPPVVMLDPPKNYLKRSKASVITWSRGVMRYHRAKILEKLGRVEESEADWKWIEENRLPPDDRLH